jgi:hypothetical protein
MRLEHVCGLELTYRREPLYEGLLKLVAPDGTAEGSRSGEGDVWPADAPGLSSPDLMCGAAGVGHCFLRVLAPEPAGPRGRGSQGASGASGASSRA